MSYLKTSLPVFLIAILLAACGGSDAPQPEDAMPQDDPAAEEPTDEDPVLGQDTEVVEVEVTEDGFEPDEIELETGVPAQLVFTRTSEDSCAEGVESPELGIPTTELPVNEPVDVEVIATESGEFTFACGQDMMEGTIIVSS